MSASQLRELLEEDQRTHQLSPPRPYDSPGSRTVPQREHVVRDLQCEVQRANIPRRLVQQPCPVRRLADRSVREDVPDPVRGGGRDAAEHAERGLDLGASDRPVVPAPDHVERVWCGAVAHGTNAGEAGFGAVECGWGGSACGRADDGRREGVGRGVVRCRPGGCGDGHGGAGGGC